MSALSQTLVWGTKVDNGRYESKRQPSEILLIHSRIQESSIVKYEGVLTVKFPVVGSKPT
jgi:hypothetical protein